MREVKCAETGHSVYLDEATGKIDSFRFSNQAGAQRVANAVQRVLDMHGDPPVNDSVLLELRGVEVNIVAFTIASWTNDRTTRWRVDGDRLVPTLVT
jgi:hypothetical protein